MTKSFWPHERDDALRALVASGLTYSVIADAINRDFGSSYTRCAVMGRAHRLGLMSQSGSKGGDPPSLKEKRAKAQNRKRDTALKTAKRSNLPASYLRTSQAGPKIVCDAPTKPDDPLMAITPFTLSLIELTTDHCRWPNGDGVAVRFTFCGKRRLPACSYCAAHQRVSLRHAA